MRSWPMVAIPNIPGDHLPLRLFDTSRAQVERIDCGPTARMYVCGITPYDATHIGHAATYTTFDLIARFLRCNGHDVAYVQNVTDVDDPLLERAAATGVDWHDLALAQIDLFRFDMTELRVLPPTDFVSVIDSVPQIAAKVNALADIDAAYQVGGDWYFDVSQDPDFGQVAQLASDVQVELFDERGGDSLRPGKRQPLDSLLWRGYRSGEPSWPSGQGEGRPGWHIECVSIATDYLGPGIDIQGGGSDLAFPHHEMSASLGYVLHPKVPFAQHYVHAGLVSFEGEKMSKSRGNLVFVSKLIAAGVDPMAIRLALLANHYRDEWEWTDDLLTDAQHRLGRWRAAVAPPGGPPAAQSIATIRAALANDLNAPAALAAVDDWVDAQATTGGEDEAAPGLMSRTIDALLGVAL